MAKPVRVNAFQKVGAESSMTRIFGASVPVARARRFTWIGFVGLACSVLVGVKVLAVATWRLPLASVTEALCVSVACTAG